MPHRLSPRRRTFLVGMTGLAVAVVGALVAMALGAPDAPGRPVASRDSPSRSSAPSAARSPEDVPVVLVHGYGGTTDNMTTIAARLRADGRRTFSVSLPGRGAASILDSVRAVERVVRSTGADTVDLVGYSLGGVVVRAWVKSERESATARYAVTIASPHHGAQLAETAAAFDPAGCTLACAELRPGSQFLRDLNAGDETPGAAAWVTIWTAADQTVTPVESATLHGAVNVRIQDVCADSRVGHGSINRNPLPVGLVVLALRGRLPAAPPPAQCAAVRAAGT